MKSRHLLITGGTLLLLLGCVSPRYSAPVAPQSDYVRLYSKGGWGFDSDIWIYPDDHFTVSRFAAGSHRLDEQYSGINPRLFHSIIQRVQQRSAWELSTASLHRDIEMARRGARAAYGVMDSSHFYLDIRSGTRRLQADCYAPQAYSQFFPDVRSLRTFAQLTNAILDGIAKSKQANWPNQGDPANPLRSHASCFTPLPLFHSDPQEHAGSAGR